MSSAGGWLLFGSLVAVAVYVHRTCMRKLGPNREDNTVRVYPANPSASNAAPLQPPVLAVILGWGGSTSKQLRRLVAHYTDVLQCPVATYINPMTGFLHNALDDTYVLELLQEIQQHVSSGNSPTASGFVCHAHSNNGALVLVELKKHLQDPASRFYPLRLQLRGVVFDSAPALLGMDATGGGLLGEAFAALKRTVSFVFPCVAIVLGRAQYVHPFWTPAILLWSSAYRAVHRAQALLSGHGASSASSTAVDTRASMAAGLRTHVLPVPHLFLYSAGDKLLPSNYIEEYIAFLRALRQPTLPSITVHDFKTTGHVQHFLRKTEEYTALLGSFLRQAQQADSTRKTISDAQRL